MKNEKENEMSEIESVEASLNIELNVTCPHCEDYIDLLSWKMTLNDDGYIIRQAIPDGSWTDSHEKFKEDVICPNCNKPFTAEGISW